MKLGSSFVNTLYWEHTPPTVKQDFRISLHSINNIMKRNKDRWKPFLGWERAGWEESFTAIKATPIRDEATARETLLTLCLVNINSLNVAVFYIPLHTI